jgi:hypothetical protein
MPMPANRIGQQPKTVLFPDIPLGARFSFLTSPDKTYVCLDTFGVEGVGLIVQWTGLNAVRDKQVVIPAGADQMEVRKTFVILRS